MSVHEELNRNNQFQSLLRHMVGHRRDGRCALKHIERGLIKKGVSGAFFDPRLQHLSVAIDKDIQQHRPLLTAPLRRPRISFMTFQPGKQDSRVIGFGPGNAAA